MSDKIPEGYEWIEETVNEVSSFWILNSIRDMLLKHALLVKEELLQGFKIEWRMGDNIELKTLVPIQE